MREPRDHEAGLGEANLDLVTDIIACPGLDYCSLANARSIPVAAQITDIDYAAGRVVLHSTGRSPIAVGSSVTVAMNTPVHRRRQR